MTAEIAPLRLTAAMALRVIREIAADTNHIVVIAHARRRGRQRDITRRQIELCAQKGTIIEGPFMNQRGNWQVSLQRHAAGEEITCAVVIERRTRLIVITTF